MRSAANQSDPGQAVLGDGAARPPAITAPLVPILAAVSIGIVVDRAVESMGRPPETWTWALSAVAATALAGLVSRRPRLGMFPLLAACVALGGGWHHHRRSDLAPVDLAWSISDSPHPVWLRGVVREAPGLRDGGEGRVSTRFVIDVTAVRDGEAWRPATGRALTTVAGDRTDIRAGRAIDAAGSLARVAAPLNPGEFDYRDYLRGRGIWLRLAVKDPASIRPGDPRDDRASYRRLGAVRAWSRRQLVGALDPETAPLASALLLGRREEIDDEVNDAFVRTGTTHLLAISGLHLQVLAVVLGLAFYTVGLSRTWSAAGVALAIVGYAVLVGLTPSVVRSAAMTVTICLAVICYRQSRTLNNLALAGLVTLAFNPSDLFDVGCQLSFLAIVALVWLMPEARHVLEAGHQTIRDRLEGPPSPLDALERRYEPSWKKVTRRLARSVFNGLLASTVVWLAALPLVMLRFHLFSPIGIVLNIPLILVTSGALLSGGIGLGLSALWAPLGLPWGWLTSKLLSLTISMVRWGAAISGGHRFVAGPPWWWTCGFYAVLGAALVSAVILRERGTDRSRTWFAWRRLLWLLVVLWLVPGYPLAMVSDRPATLEADVLAVGHGLAVVMQTPSGAAYLYDCGRMGDPTVGRRVIAPALWARGISRLNSVILSHADDDHYNGLTDLFDRFGIGEACIPPGFGGPENPGAAQLVESIQRRGIPIRTVTTPDSWTVGGSRFRVWHPPAGWDKDDAADNARSVVLEVESAGRRLLLTGDLEQLGLVELVARPVSETPVDVMLSPHHGGKTANPSWLYDWARPRSIVVSQRAPVAGSVDLLSKLEQEGTPVYRTWRDGAIRLSWEPSGIVIKPFLQVPEPITELAATPPVFAALWLPTLGPNTWRWGVGIGGFLIGLIGFALAAVAELGAWTLVAPRRTPKRSEELASGAPLSVIAPDGARLSGRWFPTARDRGSVGTVLLLHGFGESSDQLAAARVPELTLAGWDVVVPDSRGYGESAGPFATFGTHESGDVAAWIESVQKSELSSESTKSLPIVVWGRSMGGGIAARAAASDPRISALILESPLLDLHAAVASILRNRRLPGSRFLARRVLRRANRLARVALDRPRLEEVAPRIQCAVLIVQGTEDSLASMSTVRALADRFAGTAEVVEVPGAGHTNVVGVGGEDLWRQILGFLNRHRLWGNSETIDPERC